MIEDKSENYEFDWGITHLNERYQTLLYSRNVQRQIKKEKYLKYLKNRKYKKIIEDILFKLFVRIPSSLNANIYSTDSLKENDLDGKKVVIYSCIVGNYDKILEPLMVEPGVEYLMFTDLDIDKGSSWKKVDITRLEEYKTLSALQLNRKIKMLPYKYLPECDYSIYIDGLIEIVGSMKSEIRKMGNAGLGVHFHNQRDCIYDEAILIKYAKKANMKIVNEQLRQYKNDGFPCHFGLYENTILIRNHNDNLIKSLMEQWWEEYEKYSTRDQLSLPYLIWKNQIEKDKIYIMGNNINRNPRFNRGNKHIWEE